MGRRRSKTANAAYSEKRLPVNVLSFLLTCAVLLVAVNASDDGFWKSLDKITKNLEVAFEDLGNDLPNYTDYKGDEVYFSSNAPFNARGMSGLYNLTVKFMNWVLRPNDLLMKDFLSTDGHGDIVVNTKIGIAQTLKYYWGLLLVVLILLLITLLVPVCGLFFCCCRCCGNCGARSQPCDKKRDLCKKICQGTLLIILGTALLFCVVCAFASNQQLQSGIEEFPQNMRNVKNDAITYLSSTKNQATNLCVKNYQDFAKLFKTTIEQAGIHVMQQLNIWSNATAMMNLNTFVNTIPDISTDLQTLKDDTNSLRTSASQLNDAMRKVKKDLLLTLERCGEGCTAIKNNISQLQTNIDFNKLPDVSPTIAKLNEFNTDELRKAAEEGKQKLDDIENKIEHKMNETLIKAIGQVDQAGETIKKYLANITDVVNDVQHQINSVNDTIDDMNHYIDRYGQYRYYGSLGISCILLLIAICIAFGLICGICGKRPDGYSDNCCNKGAGSQFLICAVMIMFISTIFIGVITSAMLLSGLATDRVLCYPLRNPVKSRIVNLLDDMVAKKQPIPDLDLSIKDILQRCYGNESIYKVFNLKNKFDIDTIRTNFNISASLNEMISQLDNILDKDFQILSNRNLIILRNLSGFDPSINFDQFQHELNENFTNLSLNEISTSLRKLADSKLVEDVKQELQLSILHIDTYNDKLLSPMKEKASEVMKIAQRLDSALKMNSSSFPEAINNLIEEIEKAQTILSNNGTQLLKEAAEGIGNIIKGQVNSYLDRVTNVTSEELGRCGPLSVALNATLVSTCDKIILPWNGFWVTLLFTLLLFIPTIIVSVKLATLYQKYKQNGQYVETEYLYDAYADRGDNIPLSSRGAKRAGANKKKKGKKHEERPQNMGGEVVAREYVAGSHPPDSRYADMAPKHWEEFPNGGPPQYQRAPTEYERPPPYYYPGSGEQ